MRRVCSALCTVYAAGVIKAGDAWLNYVLVAEVIPLVRSLQVLSTSAVGHRTLSGTFKNLGHADNLFATTTSSIVDVRQVVKEADEKKGIYCRRSVCVTMFTRSLLVRCHPTHRLSTRNTMPCPNATMLRRNPYWRLKLSTMPYAQHRGHYRLTMSARQGTQQSAAFLWTFKELSAPNRG